MKDRYGGQRLKHETFKISKMRMKIYVKVSGCVLENVLLKTEWKRRVQESLSLNFVDVKVIVLTGKSWFGE